MRFLFYLLIAYVLWIAVSAIIKALSSGRTKDRRLAGEDLVLCVNCGIYFPSSAVVRRKGQEFCGPECASKFKVS